MRQKLSDEEIKQRIYDALQNRAKDGFEAEGRRTSIVSESMTTIGG